MDIKIDRVNENNVDRWVKLLNELALFEQMPPLSADVEQRLKTDAKAPGSPFEAYLANSGDESIGVLTLFTTYSTFQARPILYIEDIFVLEAYRRQGIGQILFDFCISLGQSRDCGRLEWNVLEWNTIAKNFYRKNQGVRVENWAWYRLDLDTKEK